MDHFATRHAQLVPLVVRSAPPPSLIASLLMAHMNGVLTVADLAEMTGVPCSAVTELVLDLVQRGVVLLEES